MHKLLCVPVLLGLLSPISSPIAKPVSALTLSDQLKWGYLNPLRGNKSPGAANLWGDRTKNGATGMLVRFNKGFSSPPHIHNISYRGIVINGQMHNDDPTAEHMWMPQGSFWTQPAGGDHITSANGEENLIYLEIESGPYLVKPSKEHFDNGEAPLNLHASNMVWQTLVSTENQNIPPVQSTMLWGSDELGKLGGALVKIPVGFTGEINVDAEEFRVVVISGELSYQSQKSEAASRLLAGSYFSSMGEYVHKLNSTVETVIYIRNSGRFEVNLN